MIVKKQLKLIVLVFMSISLNLRAIDSSYKPSFASRMRQHFYTIRENFKKRVQKVTHPLEYQKKKRADLEYDKGYWEDEVRMSLLQQQLNHALKHKDYKMANEIEGKLIDLGSFGRGAKYNFIRTQSDLDRARKKYFDVSKKLDELGSKMFKPSSYYDYR